jgi:hypothetical protein
MKPWLPLLLLALLSLPLSAEGVPAKGACLVCHRLRTPKLFSAWLSSAHARNGVTCLDCHEALASEPDSYQHGGATISLFVTPRDCSGCHEVETGQFLSSPHASSAGDLARVDPRRAAAYGDLEECGKCHGLSHVRDPRPRPGHGADTRPDHAVGRRNMDGSLGSCTACHAEHAFSRAVARADSTCTACHSRDHSARHGADLALAGGRRPGVPALDGRGRCASCHLVAGPGGTINHFNFRRRP